MIEGPERSLSLRACLPRTCEWCERVSGHHKPQTPGECTLVEAAPFA